MGEQKPPFDRVGPPRWDDRPVYIVGGGPSLQGFDFSRLPALGRTVGVNKAAWLAGCEVMVTLDIHFLRNHAEDIEAFIERGGEAWLAMPHTNGFRHIAGAHYIRRSRANGLSESPGEVYGVHSGFAALNLAYLKGARFVGLLGMDMRYGREQRTHWHSGYEWHNPRTHRWYDKWATNYERTAHQFRDAGVEVVNYVGSPESIVEAFEKRPLHELAA